jgi:Tfp pilus assembly protein PilX
MAKDRRGSILVYTLVVMSLLCLIATSLLSRSIDDYRADSALADRIRAHYLAEAGIAYAQAHLARDSFVPCPSGRVELVSPENLFPAGFTPPEISIERGGSGIWQIVSIGRSGVAKQIIRVPLD